MVAVLWLVVLLSLMAVAILNATRATSRNSRLAVDRAQDQAATDAGVRLAVLAMMAPPPAQRWYADGVPHELRFDGYTMSVEIEDEAGKIDLNYGDRETLQALFTVIGGFNSTDAALLADRVVRWRDHGTINASSSTLDFAQDRKSPYKPRRNSFQSIDELKLVPGMTGGLFEKIAPSITVYSKQRTVDIHAASRDILLVHNGNSPSDANEELQKRAARDRSAETPASGWSALVGKCFKISLTARSPTGIRFTRNTILEVTDDPDHPIWILALSAG